MRFVITIILILLLLLIIIIIILILIILIIILITIIIVIVIIVFKINVFSPLLKMLTDGLPFNYQWKEIPQLRHSYPGCTR